MGRSVPFTVIVRSRKFMIAPISCKHVTLKSCGQSRAISATFMMPFRPCIPNGYLQHLTAFTRRPSPNLKRSSHGSSTGCNPRDDNQSRVSWRQRAPATLLWQPLYAIILATVSADDTRASASATLSAGFQPFGGIHKARARSEHKPVKPGSRRTF